MKRVLPVAMAALAVASLLQVSPIALGEPQKDNRSKTCVYRKLSCLDDCQYHQDTSEIRGCEKGCKRKYACSIPKVKNPQGL